MRLKNRFLALALLSGLGACADSATLPDEDSAEEALQGTATPICPDQHFTFDYQILCGGIGEGYRHCHSVCTTDYSIGVPQLGPHGPQIVCVEGETTCEDTCSKCPGDP